MLGPIPPDSVFCVGQADFLRISRIPGVLCHPYFLGRYRKIKWRLEIRRFHDDGSLGVQCDKQKIEYHGEYREGLPRSELPIRFDYRWGKKIGSPIRDASIKVVLSRDAYATHAN